MGQTDVRIAASLNAPLQLDGGGTTKVAVSALTAVAETICDDMLPALCNDPAAAGLWYTGCPPSQHDQSIAVFLYAGGV